MRKYHFCHQVGRVATALFLSVLCSGQQISSPAYNLLNARAAENRSEFFVYKDQDSGANHGIPSGFFGNTNTIHLNTGCIDDPTQASGCSNDPNRLDIVRGTVMSISFDAQPSGSFAGLNIVEPDKWVSGSGGNGYDFGGAVNLVLDIRSPSGAEVQLGVDGCTTQYMTVPTTWTSMTIPLASLGDCSGSSGFAAVHILFSIAINSENDPNGATFLVDNVHFDPEPTIQAQSLGFPVGTQTFGVLPSETGPIGTDQSSRNVAPIYESSLALLALLERGSSTDLDNAKEIADSFDYAIHNDNHGDALPLGSDGSVGLHNAYESGDLALLNNQSGANESARAGDVRLAGFTATQLCPATGYCLVLDGATGGNNAFAIVALISAYERLQDITYLNDATIIGNWIISNLTDRTGTGYGGYYVGYPDMGVPPPKPLITSKSVENNADIFAAFQLMGTVYDQLGNTAAAAAWRSAAEVAGDFVMQMFDPVTGKFNGGTVPPGATGNGVCATGPAKGPADVINTCDFLDANTFTTLALASSSRYQSQIDWRLPVRYAKAKFLKTISAANQTFQGFSLVLTPLSGSDGIAWEFTGQMVATMRLLDQIYGSTEFQEDINFYLGQLSNAQQSAPFGDGSGLVASTLANGENLPPSDQCLNTAYQCIPERVGIAATTWAIAGESQIPVFTSSTATFVNQLYLDLLQRAADPDGLSAWISEITSQVISRSDAASQIFLSSESRNLTFVTDSYLGVLSRAPDFNGWTSSTLGMRNGMTPLQLVSGLLNSAEGQGIYGGLDDAAFLQTVYQRVLQREPDPGGYAAGLAFLNNGGTREQVMLGFVVSPEFSSLIRNVSDVNSLYLTLLDRSGDATGVSNWTAQLNAGVPLASIVADFIASDEFRAKIN